MDKLNLRNRQITLLIARLLLGIIFFMQGYGKVFTWKVEDVFERFFKPFTTYHLSEPFLRVIAYYTSYTELIAGFLLIIGLFRNVSLYVLGSVLVIVSFGHGLASPIWPLDDVLFRFMLLAFLLWMPDEQDVWRMDRLIWK